MGISLLGLIQSQMFEDCLSQGFCYAWNLGDLFNGCFADLLQRAEMAE